MSFEAYPVGQLGNPSSPAPPRAGLLGSRDGRLIRLGVGALFWFRPDVRAALADHLEVEPAVEQPIDVLAKCLPAPGVGKRRLIAQLGAQLSDVLINRCYVRALVVKIGKDAAHRGERVRSGP